MHGLGRVGSPPGPAETQPLMLQRPRATPIAPSGAPLLGINGASTRGKGEAQCVAIDDQGHAFMVPMRKARLVSELGLRHRDIRALEPGVALPYPASIFVRKQALVLNLEGLKVIISQDRALIISVPSTETLSSRLKPTLDSPVIVRMAAIISLKPEGGAVADTGATPAPVSTGDGLPAQLPRPPSMASLESSVLPFEVRALEAALLTAVTILGREVSGLEGAVRPLLTRIRDRIERYDLEALFEAQSRLDRAVGRLNRIREELEELLDDESTMASMCLSRPEPPSTEGRASSDAGQLPSGLSKTASAHLDAAFETECEEEVSEMEDLLEAYWLQSDSLLSRLRSLQQSISRTQHLLNLDLDSKRNALVALGLIIDVVLAAFEVHMTVTAVFSMNMSYNGLEDSPYTVWSIAGIATVLASFVAFITLRWVRNRGLLFLPSFGLGASGSNI
jgi:magnesium transporter